MIVEITGAGFHNMGAELMLRAARTELLSWPGIDEVAINLRVGTMAQRRRSGLATVLRLDVNRRRWASSGFAGGVSITPTSLLASADLYKPSHVDALVDASGFAFGDQWGPDSGTRKTKIFRSYQERGKPVLLLPQAFGPFTDPNVRATSRSALESTDLIFARDSDSLAHLLSLDLARPRIEVAPDFTNLVQPAPQRPSHPTVIIMPNARMTEMVGDATQSSYVGFLRTCSDIATQRDFQVLVMAHEAMDIELARLVKGSSKAVTVSQIDDPVRAKAIVGGASLVISSRFHGLVNAMSQGVPAIGTSWSHKYQHLFADYECVDALWPVSAETAMEELPVWLDERELDRRSKALREPADSLRHQAEQMWDTVRGVLDPPAPRRNEVEG